MNVYTCIDHEGHWPVGAASVVIADNEEQARELLIAELATHGLRQTKPFTLKMLGLDVPKCIVLVDGDY